MVFILALGGYAPKPPPRKKIGHTPHQEKILSREVPRADRFVKIDIYDP